MWIDCREEDRAPSHGLPLWFGHHERPSYGLPLGWTVTRDHLTGCGCSQIATRKTTAVGLPTGGAQTVPRAVAVGLTVAGTISQAPGAAGGHRNARTLQLIVVVVVVFGVSWLPLHLQSLAAYFGLESPRGAVYEVFRVLWNCMAYSNSCANPFIYHCRPTSDGPRRGRLATVPTASHQRRSRPQPTSDGPRRCPPATVPAVA